MEQNSIVLYKGLVYTYPKQPPNSKIVGWGFPQHKQKWKRTDVPKHFDSLYEEIDILNSQCLNLEKQITKIEEKIQIEESRAEIDNVKAKKFQDQINDLIILINLKSERCDAIEGEISKFAIEEDRKCKEGIWFMNNGVPTYINGDHYHYLNWFKLDSGYPDYRDRDRRWFYHWELCDKDENCIGQIYGKQRRDGYSYRVMSIIYNRARKTFNAKYGVMSMSKTDSEEMFKKGVDAFLEYPRFFKPQVQSAEDTKNKMIFKTPQQTITYKTRITKKEISLNTLIDCHPTKQNAMDGTKRQIIGADESAKFPPDVKLLKWFAIGKVCCTLGINNIIGKILMGSTVNDFESGGADFMKIWEMSDHTKIQEKTGRTDSWMWRYFIDCADGMEGFIDEYGNSVIETPKEPIKGIDGKFITIGADERITNLLAAKKETNDVVGYYELKRQFPRKESDMFASPADDSNPFDLDKVQQQIEHNIINMVENTLISGYYQWRGGDKNSFIVDWISTPHEDRLARFKYSWLPPENLRNNFTLLRNGRKSPANSHIALSSLDPYSNVHVRDDGKPSKAASHTFRKFDMMCPNESNCFVGEYWNRLADPLLVYEDMIMQCVFWGIPLLVEKNIKGCNDYFRNRELDGYLQMPPAMTTMEYIENAIKEVDSGWATTAKSQQQMMEFLSSYIVNNIGVNNKTGQIGNMPFNNTLDDWIKFKAKKFTPYDLTVSSMICVIGVNAVTSIPKKSESKSFDFYRTFPMKRR